VSRIRPLLLSLLAFIGATHAVAQHADEFGDVYVTVSGRVIWGPPSGTGTAKVTLSLSGKTAASTTVTRGAALPSTSETNRIGTRLIPGVSYTVRMVGDNGFTPDLNMGKVGMVEVHDLPAQIG